MGYFWTLFWSVFWPVFLTCFYVVFGGQNRSKFLDQTLRSWENLWRRCSEMPKLKNKVVFSKRRIRTAKMCRIYSFRNLTCFFRLLAESTFLSFSVIICEFCRLGTKSGQGRYPSRNLDRFWVQIWPRFWVDFGVQIWPRFSGWGTHPGNVLVCFVQIVQLLQSFEQFCSGFETFLPAFWPPSPGFTGFVGFSTLRNKVFWKHLFSKPETAAVVRLNFTLNSGVFHFQLSAITFVIFWTGFQEISDPVRKSQAFSTGFQEISRNSQEISGISRNLDLEFDPILGSKMGSKSDPILGSKSDLQIWPDFGVQIWPPNPTSKSDPQSGILGSGILRSGFRGSSDPGFQDLGVQNWVIPRIDHQNPVVLGGDSGYRNVHKDFEVPVLRRNLEHQILILKIWHATLESSMPLHQHIHC